MLSLLLVFTIFFSRTFEGCDTRVVFSRSAFWRAEFLLIICTSLRDLAGKMNEESDMILISVRLFFIGIVGWAIRASVRG